MERGENIEEASWEWEVPGNSFMHAAWNDQLRI